MPQCDSCGERRPKCHVILVNDGVELICDECEEEMADEDVRSALYEDALANGDPWAFPKNPELWNGKYATTDE